MPDTPPEGLEFLIRHRKVLATIAVAICFLVAVFAPGPSPYYRSLMSLHDFLHVPGFVVVTWALLFGWPELAKTRPRRLLHLAVVAAVSMAVGVAVEAAQAATGGSFDPGDVMRDAGGTAIGVLLAMVRWPEWVAGARWVLGAGAVAVLSWFLVPPLSDLADEVRAWRQFPVLADFGAASELERFGHSEESRAAIEPVDGGQHALRLTLLPGAYPGIAFDYFPCDWRGWRRLVITCSNPDGRPLPLTVRIHDRQHNQEYTDRYNRTFQVPPGRSEIDIPLSEVAAAPRGRTLDLARVAGVVVFSGGLRERRTLLIDDIRLR